MTGSGPSAADTGRIRVLVVDDNPDHRMLVAHMLDDEPTIELVGAARDRETALRLCEELQPDVVLLDWIMPAGGGPKAAADIIAVHPAVKVLGFSAGEPTQASYEMMRGGAVGFVQKGCTQSELIEAIRSAARW